ncbi:ATP-dependent DNA helicase [Mycobacterium sp. 1274756.6]|uniref:ATP-dependent helicase n=1 Tax=Mycobacterium sp. 1274756.6 TaxID=1834076 RepID=UPI0007FBB329|nr:ATP-dependent DNA helicase [Mycobacterium sp. 1274756.6]OBJ69266.1 ATP-dependent DNA helicase [Mycobacterium sp. 1274756.6]
MSHRWPAQAAAALDPDRRGVLRVLGGPGTGKTTLLVDAAAAHIGAGADPGSVLLLTGAGRMPAAARNRLTRTLLSAGGATVIAEPLVRTVHGYAFAVLALAAQRAGDPPPRLVTSAEQHGIIAELLAGDLEDRAGGWPADLHPALPTTGFADELADLLARCAERGVDSAALQRLGRDHKRPEWIAAGRFARQYEQVMRLRAAVGTAAPQATVPTLGAAELVGAALAALADDPDLLAAERDRIDVLLVDDAQQLDPQAARLVRVLAAGARTTLLAGDPNQAVYGFRGADPAALLGDDTPAVHLVDSHRCAPAVADAVSAVAARLPGTGPARRIAGRGPGGAVSTRVAASGHAEAALIADTLRRAHLIDGVPWSEMAVIVRSVPRSAAALSRALSSAGVPVELPAPRGALAQQPAVAALLAVLAAGLDGLDGAAAEGLLTGPIGRVDPVTLRSLRRALRRAAADPARGFPDLLVDALTDAPPAGLAPVLARPLQRVAATLRAARRHTDDDPRLTLWQAWAASGLQRRWLTALDRGGAAALHAGRDLDAVNALFDVADRYVARTGGASVRGLLDHVAALQLPPAAEPAGTSAAVSVLSVHAALGREWDLVVIAGLQDGLWPNTVPRGGVLATQRLLDVLDGVPEQASVRALMLAEERRLLIAALGRARRRLLITAVDGEAGPGDADSELPSPFFTELAAGHPDAGPPVAAPPVLSAAGVVGRLRAVVCARAGAVGEPDRLSAARQLARLARAGVPGADPARWAGMTPPSTTAPLHPPGEQVVTVSPSSLGTLTDCPLRWLAEQHGGRDAAPLATTIGSLVHALIAESGRAETALLAELDRVWEQLPFPARWQAANELARHRDMVSTFLQWRAATRGQLTEVAVEREVDGLLDAPGEHGPGVRLRGRVDRVERDDAGRLVIVDVKTGRNPVTKDAAQSHAQLAAYQLAVTAGLLEPDAEPGGARLVYPAKSTAAGSACERDQVPLTPETDAAWRAQIRAAVAATAGPEFTARANDGCAHCPIRPTCPAHPPGSRP